MNFTVKCIRVLKVRSDFIWN